MKIIVLLLAFVAFTNALVGVGPLVFSSLAGATTTGITLENFLELYVKLRTVLRAQQQAMYALKSEPVVYKQNLCYEISTGSHRQMSLFDNYLTPQCLESLFDSWCLVPINQYQQKCLRFIIVKMAKTFKISSRNSIYLEIAISWHTQSQGA